MGYWRLRQALSASRYNALSPQQRALAGGRWVALAQVAPELQQSTPPDTPPVAPPEPGAEAQPQKRSHSDHEITLYTSAAYGFDKQSAVDTPTGPLQVKNRRIYSLAVTAEYSLDDRTDISLTVPYVHQTACTTTGGNTVTQTGKGIGDATLYLEHSFPRIAKGTKLSVALGMQFPTGKDPFEVSGNELPTGIGFYQPLVHVSLRKLRVPVQFYTSFDYGTAFSRNINGEKVTLPDSYGGEVGLYYMLGPEFTTQTSVSFSKVSSPFILGPGSTVGYLSQSLIYNSGGRTALRASVDVGLTEDSTDAYFGLTLMNSF